MTESNDEPAYKPGDCLVVPVSSRACERGTAGCGLFHEPIPDESEVVELKAEIDRLRALLKEALRIAHDRTTELGNGLYGRINQIRKEAGL